MSAPSDLREQNDGEKGMVKSLGEAAGNGGLEQGIEGDDPLGDDVDVTINMVPLVEKQGGTKPEERTGREEGAGVEG